ncbi:MAG: VCBS repeat-containing protein [Spirosomataceae bacterium]
MRFLLAFCVVSIGLVELWSCQTQTDEREKVAQTYCGSCHLYPSPDLLPKKVWERTVLPQMGILAGIKSEIPNAKASDETDLSVLAPTQLIPQAEWLKIKQFYLEKAPDALAENSRNDEIEPFEGLFVPQPVPVKGEKVPNLTCVKIDPLRHCLYTYDEIYRTFWTLMPNTPSKSLNDSLAICDMQALNGEVWLATHIGETVKVTKQRKGKVTLMNPATGQTQQLLGGLYRPTQTLAIDLNNDAQEELVTCQFGYAEGQFSVWTRGAKGAYVEKVLSATPGAIRTVATDWNGDKLPDLVTLFAQGDERIVVYLNKGNLTFEEKVLLRFPPVYGSSYFELADFNHDGKQDILYTCGDNADYSIVFKSYHGVYIFENQGDNQLKQSYFFPVNGAYKAFARDFDNDGDLDLASIAFFLNPNAKHEEGFVYFENQEGDFKPKHLNIGSLGRWLEMDAADIDGDGDIDIALGSHPLSPIPSPAQLDTRWYKGPGIVMLLNQTKQPLGL